MTPTFAPSADTDCPVALVIEADAHYLIAITHLLRDLGIRCKRNTTGRDAALQLTDMPAKPAFILLSLELPTCDCLALADTLLSNPRYAHVPLIGIGARDVLLKCEAEAVVIGFTALLPKPLPRQRFQCLVEQLTAPLASRAVS